MRRVLVTGDERIDVLLKRLGDAGVACERVARDALARAAQAAEGEEKPLLVIPLAPVDDLRAVREVRSALPDHPILVVGLDGGAPVEEDALGAGSDGVLSLDGDLVGCLVRAAERRALLSRIAHLEGRLEVADVRFRNTVQKVADGILILDEAGRIRFANAAAEALFERDLVGEEFGHPVTAGETAEIDLVRGEAEPRTAELRTTRTEWDDEPCLLVSLRDVTERRRAEERERQLIREQSARGEAEAAAERSELLAEASRRLYGSLEAERILDTLATLLPGRIGDVCLVETVAALPWLGEHRAVGGPDHGPGADLVRRLRQEGLGALPVEPLEEGVDPAWIDGPERLGIARTLPLPLSTEGEVVAVMAVLALDGGASDPGERVLAREFARRASLALENARLFRQASQASRAKSDFLNVVSHELRTPLTGIMGYAGLLEEGLAGPMTGPQRRYLRGIARNSEALLRVIDQILLYVDTEQDRTQVQREETSLAELVDDVVSLARPMARRAGLELRVRASGHVEDARLQIDGGKVRQILLHLLTNAVKFTPEGWIELKVDLEPDALVVVVTDTGIGIPAGKHEAIFEPFTQVESPETRAAGGTGIGLNVARNLARMLGGTIEVESAPGEGSAFTVRLPLE